MNNDSEQQCADSTAKVIIIQRQNLVEEDKDQRGIFNRFFIQEKDNIIQAFNNQAVAKGSTMRVVSVDYVGNSPSDACLRRVATITICGIGQEAINKLPNLAAELHASFALDEFFAPRLDYAIAVAF